MPTFASRLFGSSPFAGPSGLVPTAPAPPSPFDPGLFPELVYLLPLTEGADADAGTDEQFPTVLPAPLNCASKVTLRARPGWAGQQEVSLTVVQFAFPADPGAKKGDTLLWDGRRCRVIAPAHLKGTGSWLFIVDAQIRD